MQHLNQYTQAPTLFLSSVTVRKMLRLTVFLQSYVPFHPRTKRDSHVQTLNKTLNVMYLNSVCGDCLDPAATCSEFGFPFLVLVRQRKLYLTVQ